MRIQFVLQPNRKVLPGCGTNHGTLHPDFPWANEAQIGLTQNEKRNT